jgi:hypothetical protein
MTTDYGRTWTPIASTLPKSAGWAHVIRQDPRNRNLLYIGTEMGLWASWDLGKRWVSLRGDMPAVPVRDLHVHPRENDLIVATHGRGLYFLDDITALQQIQTATQSDALLFDIRPAIRWNYWNKDGNLGFKVWAGENPPYGAMVSYYVKAAPKAVTLTITDAQGKVVRVMRDLPKDAGVNRVAWDLRYDGPTGAAPPRRRTETQASTGPWRVYNGDATLESFGTPRGPAVLPGTYTATLDVDGKTFTKPIRVALDPRYQITDAELAQQLTTGLELRELTSRANAIVDGVDDLLRQLAAVRTQVGGGSDSASAATPAASQTGDGRANPAALAAVDSAVKDLTHFRDSVLTRPAPVFGYRQYPRLREEITTVAGMVWRSISPPTSGEKLRTTELTSETADAQNRLDRLVATRIARVNELLGGTPHVLPPPKRTFVP